MKYGDRFANRKRLFSARFPTLSENGNGHDTTVPFPLADGYSRPYWPQPKGLREDKPLPCEMRKPSLLRRFDY